MTNPAPRWLAVATVAVRAAVLVPLSILALWFILESVPALYQDVPLRMNVSTPYNQRAMIRLMAGVGLAWWAYSRGWKKLRP